MDLAQPAVTRVNRKTRTEALSIFYGENKFTMPIQLYDPTKTGLREEHARLKFLRGVRLLASSGNFSLVNQLDIMVIPPFSVFEAPCIVRVQISTQEPWIYVKEWTKTYRTVMPDDEGLWDVNEVGGEYTDWDDMDSVEFAVDLQKLILAGMLVEEQQGGMAELLKGMPCGRLSEVLHLLLRLGGRKKFVFASTDERKHW